MTQPRMSLTLSICSFRVVKTWATLILGLAFFASPAFAQQTGDITGQVTDATGAGIAGVTIEASGDVLPRARTTNSAANGQYLFRLLPPGNYVLKFSFSDGSTSTRTAFVLLQQKTIVDVATGAGADMEEIVTTGSAMMADTGQGALKNSINANTIDALPVGQDYRDLMKLIPGVQYSEFRSRGPSAGGSGQDNSYQFDGVDVSLPLFGVLASEPSTHDIAQVSVVRGGAKAIGFNRSGGFQMNTVSKRGTDEFHGALDIKSRPASLVADQGSGSLLEFDEDRTWTTASLGGPIVRDQLYFYASYYRPDHSRKNVGNLYGPVGDFESVRDEYFGKFSWAPTDSIMLDASYRTSERNVSNASIGADEAATASSGTTATQDVLILEGSWIISDQSSMNFKYTDFENLNSTRPDTIYDVAPVLGNALNTAALGEQGYFVVPWIIEDPLSETDPIAAQAYNDFVQPIINQYGYDLGGVPTGGGAVGGYSRTSNQDFFRESFEISFDHLVYAGNVTHDLHVGYQWMENAEDLNRLSNGWGIIDVPGGYDSDLGDEVYYEARVSQQSLIDSDGGSSLAPSIYSSSVLRSFEINDSIEVGDWTFNIGVLVSSDVLHGQGLAKNANNPATGFELSPGTKYKMYEVDWSEMIQPRLGANWDYSDTASIYVNFAQYNPSASSLARAASWDRNLQSDLWVRWDADGNFIESEGVDSSSGKQFQRGIDPRVTNEFMIGTTQDISGDLTVRAHARYKKSYHFWEDTWNWSRTYSSTTGRGGDAPDNIPNEPYIPDDEFAALRGEIGGSTYVIAELDGGFTKYYEASVEFDWNHDQWFVTGSYTWSHYYGNVDQDSTTFGSNDFATFIGSSWLADGRGRQIWDNKKGDLRGDRRHMLKLYGYYSLPWDATLGAYYVLQSGEPWETWDGTVYGYSATYSNTRIRFAEPAGANTGDSHYQIDLNYSQNFEVFGDQNIQLRAEIFNATDKQTGYNIERALYSAQYGQPLSHYRPRLVQLSLRYEF